MKHSLIFEMVGDINSVYPYICIYFAGKATPFMEIGVTKEKTLIFTFYANAENVMLTADQWSEIISYGCEFLPKAIANNEDASM